MHPLWCQWCRKITKQRGRVKFTRWSLMRLLSIANNRPDAEYTTSFRKISHWGQRLVVFDCLHNTRMPARNLKVWLIVGTIVFCLWSPMQLSAQNLGSAGATWGGSWQFQSTTTRSINVQQADIMKRAESGFYDSFGPDQTTVNNTTITDNRSNYVEANSADGSQVEISNRVGDDIGKVSNVTGAINTGSTEIKVDGNSNTVNAINSADSQGCLDGSIHENRLKNHYFDSASAASVLNTVAGLGVPDSIHSSVSTGGTQSNCVTR